MVKSQGILQVMCYKTRKRRVNILVLEENAGDIVIWER